MSRQIFLCGAFTAIGLFSCINQSAAQITGGNVGGNNQQGTNNTGGLIGGNATGNATGGLIGGGATAGQTSANQGGIRSQANSFQNLSAVGGGAIGTAGRGGGQTTRQFGGAGGRGGGQGTGGARGGGQVQSTRRVLRPVLRIAFDYPQAAPKVESSLNRQFDRISIRLKNRFRSLSLKAGAKGVVTLTGRVESEGDKKLAAAYVRLEPGVRSIENNLVVATATTP